MKVATSMTVALLAAATALALPVDTEQHPMVSEAGHRSPEIEATETPVPQSHTPHKAETSAPESHDDLMALLKAVFKDKEMSQEGLGRGCFCANGSICCDTASGLDCAQGLCGI